MDDLISRQAAIDYCYALINAENPSDPSDEWNYSQERINQTEVILHHLEFMPSAQSDVPDTNVGDMISRQAAIDALWKALYEYEDKTEKQFIESEELDVGDWFLHRIFVQSMSDIDRQTILELPTAQRWIPCSERLPDEDGRYLVTCKTWGMWVVDWNIWHNEPKPSWLWDQGVTAWMPLPEPYGEDGDNDG